MEAASVDTLKYLMDIVNLLFGEDFQILKAKTNRYHGKYINKIKNYGDINK